MHRTMIGGRREGPSGTVFGSWPARARVKNLRAFGTAASSLSAHSWLTDVIYCNLEGCRERDSS